MAHPTRILSPEKHLKLPYDRSKNGLYRIVPPKRQYSGITQVNKKNNPDGYIYFIKSVGLDFYKIGVSSNPKRRISDINSNLPFDVEILAINFIVGAYEVESKLSKKYKKYNKRREWYTFSKDQAADIMIYLHNLNVIQDGSTDR